MQEITISPLDATCFEAVLDPDSARSFAQALDDAREALSGRALWHVNSTSTGGGVAEMLQAVLGYLLGAGIETRWVVIEGNEEFFVVTKRIHHLLHGDDPDPGPGTAPLGPAEHDIYCAALEPEAEAFTAMVRPGDVVILHDPQTAGLAPYLRSAGAGVIWNCHVGSDVVNDATEVVWSFLRPFVEAAHGQVFSRHQYIWPGLDRSRVAVIPPCIDAFAPKNQFLDEQTVTAILAVAKVVPSEDAAPAGAGFVRQDGTPAVVGAAAQMIEDGPVPSSAAVVTQISRWDSLKDHEGVMRGFVDHVPAELEAHLVLAGPSPESVTDDPEGADTLAALRECWENLPAPSRSRVHIACLPMSDAEENAAIVNALQRRSDVVIQKSLAEGFGLTVAEAMWKARPTIASGVGGIQDQIEDGVSGVLLADPVDRAEFGSAVTGVLSDPGTAAKLGQAGHDSVRDHYLAPVYLMRYLDFSQTVLAGM